MRYTIIAVGSKYLHSQIAKRGGVHFQLFSSLFKVGGRLLQLQHALDDAVQLQPTLAEQQVVQQVRGLNVWLRRWQRDPERGGGDECCV